MQHSPALFKFVINHLWPPFWFTGISITKMHDDYRYIRVEMKLSFFNKNYFGTHFGGNLFAMTDPFYMLMIVKNLGEDYYVWDKSANIDYIAPGKGTVYAEFHLTQEQIDDIQINTASGEKYLPTYPVHVYDQQQKLIATLQRTIYIKKKPHKRPTTSS